MGCAPQDVASPNDADDLTIGLLGGFRVRTGRREVAEPEWRLRKARSLIKLLALAPGCQLHREQLQETLWPDQDPDAAANNLHKAVHTARRALEPDLPPARPSRYLHVQGDMLVLRPPGMLRIDVDAFERAAGVAVRSGAADAYDAAVALYAGDLLPEDRYEDWAAARREALRSRHIALLLALAGLREAQGEPVAAIEALRRLVAHEPAHEAAHAALMRLLARAGHRHQALRQYQQLRDGLRRELDVDPEPGSDRLYQDILAGRLAPAISADPGSARPIGWGDGGAEPETALFGRDAEIEAIEDVLDAAVAGRGGVVLVAGEAGIGKSRLVGEVAERVLRRGGTVLVGAAYEQEGRLPYGPFAEALAPLGGLVPAAGMRAAFGDDASDFARFPASAQSALRADRQRLFAAVAELLRRRATSALTLLALEDLHAADDASLQLLHYLARTSRDSGLLIVGTFRPEDASPTSPLAGVVAALRRERLAVRLDLRPLGPGENDLFVAALLGAAPADRAVAETLYRLAAGNPLYTAEVLEALREGDRLRCVDGRWRMSGEADPPGLLVDLLTARLERLGPEAMRVLGVAAVAGPEVPFSLLRAASDLPESAVLDALDLCLARGALLETPTGYRFDHPLRRMAVYERLGRARRTSLHGRIAAVLEDLHAGRLEDQSEALGRHWALSERPGRAVLHLAAAGDRAAALHGNEAAAVAYQEAVGLLDAPGAPPDGGRIAATLWEKLGDLHALAGDAPADAEAYEAALAALGSDPATDAGLLIRINRKAAYAALARHDPDAAERRLAAAETALGDAPDTAEWGRVRLIRAMQAWTRGRFDEGRRAAEQSLDLARRRGDDLDLLNAYAMLALVFHSSGAWKAGLQLEIERLGASGDADPRLALLFDAHICLGEYHLCGDSSFEAVESYADRAIELAARTGARRAEALAWLLRGETLLVRGRWAEALPCLDRSLTLQRAVGSAAGQVFALQRLGELHAYRGDHAAADRHLTEALGISVEPAMAHHVWARVYATLAFSALERDDARQAARAIEAAAGVAERSGACAICGALLDPVAVETFLALGDIARAERHAETAERTAALWESGTWRAMAGMARARVERARGDHAAASRRFLAAAAEFERVGQRFDAARSLLGAGQAAADGADVAAAQTLAGRALAMFDDLGASIAATRARTLLASL